MKHKKLSARVLSLVLTMAMVCTMLPMAAFAAEEKGLANVYVDNSGWNPLNGQGFYEGDDSFEGKIPQEPVKTFAKAQELVAPGGTIWCISMFTVEAAETWDLSSKPGVTLKRYAGNDGMMVAVSKTGTLTLKNVVIDGTFQDENGDPDPNKLSDAALVHVQNSGHLIMDTGSVIENNNTKHSYGAGVRVADFARLTMQGNAAIRNNHAIGKECYGGGITVSTSASATIQDNATITGNTSGMDGAGVYVFGTINLSGGTISGNTSADTGGGIFLNNTATANFTGGSVMGNVANAVSKSGVGMDIYSNQCKKWTISGDWKPSEGILLNLTAILNISSELKHPIKLEEIRKLTYPIIDTVIAKGTDTYTLIQADVDKFSCTLPVVGFELDAANNQIKLVKIDYTGTQATAPVAASKTDTSITLKAQTITGESVQYAMSTSNTAPAADSADWKDTANFSGLTANTEYYFFARVKETITHGVGTASTGAAIKTAKAPYTGDEATAPVAAGKTDTTVTLAPQTVANETVEYGCSTAADGEITWQDSNAFTGLTASTDYYFFARVKENDTHAAGATSAATAVTTDKWVYAGANPKAPSADSKTDTSITLKAQTITGETVQYGYSTTATGTITWQDANPVFIGLTAGTDYYFYTRIQETEAHQAGPTSAGVMIKTKALTAAISGIVTDENNAPVAGAAVKIMNGQTELATAMTDKDGKYTFSNIDFGTYSLVVEKAAIKATKTITIDSGSVTENVQLPKGSNTVVETKPSTPPTAADGLNDLFDPTKVGTNTDDTKGITTGDLDKITKGGSVTVTLIAESKQAEEVSADVEKIKAQAPGKALTLLDLRVNKVVIPNGGTAGNPITMTELPTVIEIVVEIPEHMRTAADISVYRVHGTGDAEQLPGSANADGEYAVRKGNYIHIFTKKFSTYALGYTASSVSITSEGATGVSGAGNYAAGAQVAINAGTKSGYTFKEWEVIAGGVTLADPSGVTTTFIMPAANVELKATWTYNGSSDSDDDSSTPTYSNTVNKPDNGTVTLTPAYPSKGQTVTIMTKPNTGYVVDKVTVKDANGNAVTVTAKGAGSYTFIQPANKVTVTVTYKKTSAAFVDINSTDWFYSAVMTATDKGWFSGTSETTFSPNVATNRGMIATILHRMESMPNAGAVSFDDVAADAYYANGVAWAQKHGIVTGYGNGQYGPNDSITREQLAAILYRYAAMKGYDTAKTAALDKFADASGVSGYAKDAMSWAVGCELISGRGDNTLAPTATATRAEVATILVRFETLFKK